jgi:hypothetical protein
MMAARTIAKTDLHRMRVSDRSGHKPVDFRRAMPTIDRNRADPVVLVHPMQILDRLPC